MRAWIARTQVHLNLSSLNGLERKEKFHMLHDFKNRYNAECVHQVASYLKPSKLLSFLYCKDYSEIAPEICNKCKSGERISLGPADEQTMLELAKHVHRIEHDTNDAFKPFMIDHEIFKSAQSEIGTLDLCPFLRAGACTWFSQSEPNLVSMIDGTDHDKKYEFAAIGTKYNSFK